MMQRTKNILISRLSAIGDCIETIPLAVALKEVYPNSKITWVVDCGVDQLLRMHDRVDEVLRVPKNVLTRPKEAWRLRRQLLDRRFDIAFDPQGLLKSAVIAWLSQAPVRIGFDKSQARERAWLFYTDRVRATMEHLVDRHLQLLEPLECAKSTPTFGLKPDAESRSWCDRYLASEQLEADPFVVINPGAGWASRRWPPERFGEIAKVVWNDFRLRSIVVWSGEEERNMAATIQQIAPTSLMSPPTSLLQLAALLNASRFVISSDTGPMHLAAALGVPCVALFSVTQPEYCGPYGTIHEIVRAPIDPSEVVQRKKDGDAWMRRITTEQVLEACTRLFNRLDQSAPAAPRRNQAA